MKSRGTGSTFSSLMQRVRGKYALTGSLMLMLASSAALAHHSFAAAYDMQDPIKVTGKIVEVRLTNPHSHFFIEAVNEAGETVQWKFEAGTPSGMIRNGYSTDVIKKGDTVTIGGFRARNESNNGMLTELVLSDGTVYGMFGPQQNPGAR